MFGKLSEEIQKLMRWPASEAWKIFGTLELAKICAEYLPHVFQKVDVEVVDGGVGTIVKLSFPPAAATTVPFSTLYHKMFGTISEEMQVNVPADEAWKLYGTLRLAQFVVEQLPHVLHKTELVEGDGSVGTILKLTLPPGTPGFSFYKEKFTVINDEKRVKEAEVVEGGYLELGFTLYRVRFEVIENGENSCITKSTIDYEVKEEEAANASIVTIQPLVIIMKAVANYLTKEQK